MIKLSYDFHIHSCLSPCGDNDMTPANIVGMAAVLGLDAIALTDHNSSGNCEPFIELAHKYGIIPIPGMEVTTIEEVHVLCLFDCLEKSQRFNKLIYDKLIKVKNREDIFGEQLMMDIDENIIKKEENLLINITQLSFDNMYDVVYNSGGAMIPAHIDKNSNSVISNLGFIPENSKFRWVEVADSNNFDKLRDMNRYLDYCNYITDSDAHYLNQINEPVNFIEVEERSPEAIIRKLRE